MTIAPFVSVVVFTVTRTGVVIVSAISVFDVNPVSFRWICIFVTVKCVDVGSAVWYRLMRLPGTVKVIFGFIA